MVAVNGSDNLSCFLDYTAPAAVTNGAFKNNQRTIQWSFDRVPGRVDFYVVSIRPNGRDTITDSVRVTNSLLNLFV